MKNEIGNKFGRLTAISRISSPREIYLCRCDCGKECIAPGPSLRFGCRSSCGCAKRDHLKRGLNTKHGGSYSPEFSCWSHMRKRCNDPKDPKYYRYGGRGITVCDRWRDSFENFLKDMGRRPSASHSIERDDNNGNYEPSNCHWATPTEQGRNKSTTIRVTVNGETKSLAAWAEYYGLTLNRVYYRIHHAGWPITKALTTPARKMQRTRWSANTEATAQERIA